MRRTLQFIIAMTSALLLSACGAPRVTLMYYPQDSRMFDDCYELVSHLPGHLLDQGMRQFKNPDPATGLPDQTHIAAVWGDPVISLLCGTLAPEALTPSSQLTDINGISWFAEETTNGYRFTSTNLNVRVQVRVPDAYAPETNVLVELSSALSAYVVTD